MRHSPFSWAVIGAGPAGIASVGKLLDSGVDPQKIVWVDPDFKVGDFGTKWLKVSSNTRIGLFTKFFESCRSFKYDTSPHFEIKEMDPTDTCLLSRAAKPLQWISDHLKTHVHAISGTLNHLKLSNRLWHLNIGEISLQSKNVILATGSEPHSLSFSDIEEIPLTIALDDDKLATITEKEDVVAVFGASHSAIIIIKSLLEACDVKQVINLYLSPLRYAVYFDDWILFDDTGLKGKTALWARENIDGQLPSKLQRILSTEENIQQILPMCTKVIYATGFKKRCISIEGMRTLEYSDRSGIIAPGLFGIGIAFPEAKVDRFGTRELRVGLWKFMEHLNEVMPIWFKYEC